MSNAKILSLNFDQMLIKSNTKEVIVIVCLIYACYIYSQEIPTDIPRRAKLKQNKLTEEKGAFFGGSNSTE